MGGGAVVVTSYGLVSARREHFAPLGKDHKWDYVILDEGHKIKNCSTRCIFVFAVFTVLKNRGWGGGGLVFRLPRFPLSAAAAGRAKPRSPVF